MFRIISAAMVSTFVFCGLCAAQEPTTAQGQPTTQAQAKDAYGDPLPDGALIRLGTARTKHMSPVMSVAITPDGKLAASSSSSAVQVFDVATGKTVFEKQRVMMPQTICFSPDGKKICWIDFRGRGGIATLADGAVSELDSGANIACAAFSPDASLVAMFRFRDRLQIWDLVGQKTLASFPDYDGMPMTMAFSPDDKLFATAGSGAGFKVQLWDAHTGKKVQDITLPKMDEQANQMLLVSLAFSPDCKVLAMSLPNGDFLLVDSATGKTNLKFSEHPAKNIAFLADGKKLFGITDQGMCFWDAQSGKRLSQYALPGSASLLMRSWPPTTSAAVSADGSAVVACGPSQSVGVWRIENGKAKQSQLAGGHQGPVTSLVFSADGKSLLSASKDGTVRQWSLADGNESMVFPGDGNDVPTMVVSADGKTAAVEKAETIDVVSLPSGKTTSSLPIGANKGMPSLSISPDGRMIATGNQQGLSVWNAQSGKLLLDVTNPAPQPGVKAAVQVWSNSATAFSPDSKELVTGSEGFRLIDLLSGTQAAEMLEPGVRLNSIAFSADGRLVACGVVGDKVNVWDLTTGTTVCTLSGIPYVILSMAFSPDGKKLATASMDTTILLWNVPPLAAPASQPQIDAQRLAQCWTDLAGDDAEKANKALWDMVASGDDGVNLLKDKLKPLPASANLPEAKKLLADIDSDDYKTREEAFEKLSKIAQSVRPAIEEALSKATNEEAKARLTSLLANIANPQANTAEARQAGRAVRVLELVASKAAREVLTALAGGGPGTLTSDASGALARLGAAPTAGK